MTYTHIHTQYIYIFNFGKLGEKFKMYIFISPEEKQKKRYIFVIQHGEKKSCVMYTF